MSRFEALIALAAAGRALRSAYGHAYRERLAEWRAALAVLRAIDNPTEA